MAVLTITGTCATCQTSSQFPAERQGGLVECPICSSEIALAVPVVLPVPAAIRAKSEPLIALEPKLGESRRPRPQRERGSIWPWVGGLGGLAMVALLVALVTSITDVSPQGEHGAVSSESAGQSSAPTSSREFAGERKIPDRSLMVNEPTGKSLLMPPTEIRPFDQAGNTKLEPKNDTYLPKPPPEPKKAEAPATPKAEESQPKGRAAGSPPEVPAPKAAPSTPPRGDVSKPASRQRATEPTIFPAKGIPVPVCTSRDINDLREYLETAETLKGRKMIQDKTIALIEKPTKVRIEGESKDQKFLIIVPLEGSFRGRSLIVAKWHVIPRGDYLP